MAAIHHPDVQDLLDRQAITDVLHRYCRAVDRRDPDLLLSAYHGDAVDDHGVYKGPASGLVEFMLNDGRAVVHHQISNIVIEVDGDVARTECYLDAVHRREDETGRWDELLKCRYIDRFERREGAWRIAHRRVVYDWGRIEPATEGWWDVIEGDWTFGSRDRSDPVYEHGPWWPGAHGERRESL